MQKWGNGVFTILLLYKLLIFTTAKDEKRLFSYHENAFFRPDCKVRYKFSH